MNVPNGSLHHSIKNVRISVLTSVNVGSVIRLSPSLLLYYLFELSKVELVIDGVIDVIDESKKRRFSSRKPPFYEQKPWVFDAKTAVLQLNLLPLYREETKSCKTSVTVTVCWQYAGYQHFTF